MIKDKSIFALVDKLKLIDHFNSVQVVDYWDADLRAIGFKRNNQLLYISTYNAHKNLGIRYYMELEVLDDNEDDKFTVIKRLQNLTETELINEVILFLK
jgi:hypothetical protein